MIDNVPQYTNIRFNFQSRKTTLFKARLRYMEGCDLPQSNLTCLMSIFWELLITIQIHFVTLIIEFQTDADFGIGNSRSGNPGMTLPYVELKIWLIHLLINHMLLAKF